MKKVLSLAMSAVMAVSLVFTAGISKANAASIPSNANLVNTYGNVIPKVGTACVSDEILNPNILQIAFVVLLQMFFSMQKKNTTVWLLVMK